MIIVWGTKGITKTLESGEFKCPICYVNGQYEYKEIRKYFTFFWIPIFSYGKHIDFVECQECKTPLNPEFFKKLNPETNLEKQ